MNRRGGDDNAESNSSWFWRKGIYSLSFIAAIAILFVSALSSTPAPHDGSASSSSSSGIPITTSLRTVGNKTFIKLSPEQMANSQINKVNNEDNDNRFSFTMNASPYEQIWVNNRLPGWAMKRPSFRQIEATILPEQRICFVHVGKAGGSTVGCALGFSLHCNHSQSPLEGLLPSRSTRMFHADTYDCHDDSAYFLFVVRNPIERIKSAFLYERPKSESWLKLAFPEYYDRRKELYIDCPSFGIMEQFVQDGLKYNGHADDTCKMRAITSVRGEQHYNCHMYFNYQFHLEGIPKNGRILTIRNEHLIQDWNTIEHYIGGINDSIPIDKANETISVMNKNSVHVMDKELSLESTTILCYMLCNEIVNYKKILRQSLNLAYLDVQTSIDELRETCGKIADYEEGECPVLMPNIQQKLIETRGYVNLVNEDVSVAHMSLNFE